jgi:hypothetical protein
MRMTPYIVQYWSASSQGKLNFRLVKKPAQGPQMTQNNAAKTHA